MSFIKFVVERATVERALSIPLIADYIANQGVGDLVVEFAQQHPNYSFANLLGEFGIEIETLPVLIKDFVINHFGAKSTKGVVKQPARSPNQPKPLTFE